MNYLQNVTQRYKIAPSVVKNLFIPALVRLREEIPRERLLSFLHSWLTGQMPLPGGENHHGNITHLQCEECNKWEHQKNMMGYRGVCYCEDCFQEFFYYCEICGEVIKQDDAMVSPRGEYVCSSCFEDKYFTCCECGNVFSLDEEKYVVEYPERVVNGESFCFSCYDSLFYECEECGSVYRQGNDCNCLSDLEHEARYKPPSWNYYGEGTKRRYGLELEVITKNGKNQAIKRIIGDERLKKVESFCKHDGSLSSKGTEIVTHPATYDYLFSGRLFDGLPELPIYSFSDNDTGVHIHVTRSTISNLTLAKLILFFSNNIPFIEFVAERSHNSYCRAEKKNIKKIRDKNWKEDEVNRYEAINCTNKYTIEFRVFKGTTKPERIYKYLQFTVCIIEYAEAFGVEDMTEGKFRDYVINKTKYEYLKRYISPEYAEKKDKKDIKKPMVCVS